MGLKVDVLTDIGLVDALHDEWAALLAALERPSIYRGPEFALTSWRHFDAKQSQPRVITVRDGEDLIGLAPLRARRRRVGLMVEAVLEPLGLAEGDRISFLAMPGREAEVWDLCLDTIEGLTWDRWSTSELEVGLIGHTKLNERFASAKRYDVRMVERDEALLTDISGAWDEFHGAHKRMRRNLRALDKAIPDYRFERYVSPGDIDKGIALLEDLAAMTWKKGKVGVLKSDHTRDFYRRLIRLLATDGHSGIRILHDGEELIASQLSFMCGDWVHFHATDYNPAYEDLSPGMMMVALTIKDYFGSPAKTVDYLTGYAGYMSSWSTAKIVTEEFEVGRQPGRFSPKRPLRKANTRLTAAMANRS